jgi:hypothetical protein
MSKTSKKVTIFEGPDCSGKTTAAKHFAELTGAKYVHFSNLPQVSNGLARMYVEAMLPALLGYQDVVFDRCWLSEVPYGEAFRNGENRIGVASQRMLERLALRCGAVVVRCCPPWHKVMEIFLKRKNEEYLESSHQLKAVYDGYNLQLTELPELIYDYTTEPTLKPIVVEALRTPQHLLALSTAGNWNAETIIVGKSFAERKNQDPFYQWPFSSFSNVGCSQWLTQQLEDGEIREQDLLWINADQDLTVLYNLLPRRIMALGHDAAAELYKLKIPAFTVNHPQWFKRFSAVSADVHYPLVDYIKQCTFDPSDYVAS